MISNKLQSIYKNISSSLQDDLSSVQLISSQVSSARKAEFDHIGEQFERQEISQASRAIAEQEISDKYEFTVKGLEENANLISLDIERLNKWIKDKWNEVENLFACGVAHDEIVKRQSSVILCEQLCSVCQTVKRVGTTGLATGDLSKVYSGVK